MASKEMADFEKTPYFKESVDLRIIDDLAKSVDFEVEANHWSLLEQLLENCQITSP